MIANGGGAWGPREYIIEITRRHLLSTRVWARPQPPWTYVDDLSIEASFAPRLNDELILAERIDSLWKNLAVCVRDKYNNCPLMLRNIEKNSLKKRRKKINANLKKFCQSYVLTKNKQVNLFKEYCVCLYVCVSLCHDECLRYIRLLLQ